MTDNLRDRIAAALMTAESTDAERYALADAVIRELALTTETSHGTTYPHTPVTDVRYTRYVTQWTADVPQG